MTAIKSYTDLQQSKKLAEILPIESADTWLTDGGTVIKTLSEHITSPQFESISGCQNLVPCWSLAALLEQIPEKLFDNDGFSHELEITKQKGLYYINYLDSGGRYYHVSADCMNTLVDACVDMIIKLHE